ncbi:hypothetical protein PPERSA_04843 [Pseudocohnilembus persalinus]|uniref:Uncharacterized protein n=1 Tax=Pseudocohnilembus persalinus TaxID=266149 RepID=A0A0V0QIZ6_PSEPJ|nr:hypothetical protein PPERSA_04843 [Pseudocohnilembus persalinus]|eukprot:KRX02221.1 hypothetical protein PPERSA_04843 [Pseudocohnilembus persalinus]
MPPKKKQEEEIDISQLPEWFAINCVFKFESKKERADKLIKQISEKPLSFQKNISKNDVIQFATEKGIYVDPNTLTEKQKKDQKVSSFMESVNMELTPEVLAKAFIQFQQDLDIQGRKLKKQKIDELENPVEEKEDPKKAKKDSKKDAKKDAKKGGKQEVQEEEPEEPQEPEKEYKKAQDIIYFLLDLPENADELQGFSQQQAPIDIIVNIKQKVLTNTGDQDLSILDHKQNFEDDLKKRMDDFIENNGKEDEQNEEIQEQEEGEEEGEDDENRPKRHREIVTEEDETFIKQNKQFVQDFLSIRSKSDRNAGLRKTVYKELVWEIDPYNEEESLKIFLDNMIEEICQFSFDIQEYQKWLSERKQVPLQVKTAPPPPPEPVKQEEVPEEEEKPDDKKGKGGKAAKKDDKKGKKEEKKPVEEEKPAEAPQEPEQPVQQEQKEKKSVNEPYFFYNKTLQTVPLEQTGTGILLEAILDEIEAESQNQNTDEPINMKQKNEEEQINNILGNMNNYLNFMKQDELGSYKEREEYLSIANKSSEYQKIYDEVNEIQKQGLEAQTFNQKLVAIQEQEISDQLLYPGIDRNMMPEISAKSEALRKADKSQIYPFISCSEHEFERRQVITRFEEILKESEPERNWNLKDRVYVERHNQSTLKQSLHKALLFDPILVSKYNEKDDNLYLAMYYKNPPGRVLRQKWSAEWKVLPNLENWINFFKNSAGNNLKNDIFYDIDYQQIGNLHERTKYMFPTDNSIILGTKYQVAESQYFRYKVLKDDIIFGIKENPYELPEVFPKFWAIFDNNTRLVVETERIRDIKQEEEDAAQRIQKEEQFAKESQQKLMESMQELELQMENQKKAKKVSAKDQKLMEEKMEQEKAAIEAQIEKEKQELLQQLEEEKNAKLAANPPKTNFTFTLQNGLLVKFLTNGDVVQQLLAPQHKQLTKNFTEFVGPSSNIGNKPNSQIEVQRIISGKGSVIRYMKDGSIHVYYANGNTSYTQGKSFPWITTNNKGLRKSRSKNQERVEEQHDSINCAKRTDPQSGAKIIIREDETIFITYPEGNTYCKFQDGTEITTSPKQDLITVEHENYATIKVSLDFVKARTDTVIGMGSAYANVGVNNLFERSNNGRIVDTYLPDGTQVRGYVEKKELPGYEQFEINNVHLIYHENSSVLKVQENGEVVVISGKDRVALNENGQNEQIGKDIDYWLQFFSIAEERRAGVYTVDMNQKKLWTKDQQGNIFGLCSNGEIISKIAVSLDVNNEQQKELERPGTPDIQDGELFIEEDNKFLPQPEEIIPPRLFVINNNNTGFEILQEDQISNYKRLKEANLKDVRIIEEKNLKFENCDSFTYITRYKTIAEKKQKFINPILPRNLDVIPKTEEKKTEPEIKRFLFRNLLKFPEFTDEIRQENQENLEKYENWKKEQLKQQVSFGILEKSAEEKEKEFNIQLRILEARKRNFESEINTYDKMKSANGDQFLQRYSQIEKYLEDQNKNKLTPEEIQNIPEPEPQQEQDQEQLGSFEKSQMKLKSQRELQIKEHDNQLKYQESLKAQLKGVTRFTKTYWQTITGKDALEEIHRLNPPKDPMSLKAKLLVGSNNSQELSKTLNRDNNRNSQIMSMNQTQQSQNPRSENQYNQDYNASQLRNSQQGTQFGGSLSKKQMLQKQKEEQLLANINRPSVFTQREIDEEERNIIEAKKAYEYQNQKTMDYNVYGGKRNLETESKKVPCLLRTQPQSELNQKYIITDALTDNRLKLSSMHNRMYLKAPNIAELRQTGSHTALAKTLDKKYNLDDVENKKNLMITADLNDKLRRDLLITPISARFGVLKIGGQYQITINVKNEDLLAQRITIRQPENNRFIKVFMKQMGPIALGLTREVIVRVNAQEEIYGKVQDSFQIVSKHEIYTIPIYATIVDQEEFDRLDIESRETNKRPILKQTVQELRDQGASIISKQQENFMESQQSELLPKLPKFEKNYKIDPYQSMKKNKNKKKTDEQDELDV